MFKNKIIWLIVLIIILVVVGWLISRQPLVKPNWLNNNTGINNPPQAEITTSTPQVIIGGKTFDVIVADEPAVQRQGLSGRASLAANQGMLFVYPSAQVLTFWMKDMRFNIDLLWIAGDKVVAFEKDMPFPATNTSDDQLLRYTSPQAVDKVIEITSGMIDALGIKAGDTIILKNI